LIGQIMKKAKGKVNPADVSRVMNEEIKKRWAKRSLLP
jgi:Asp-tRNA(Asn)/Glu-tRNA(Gln) amidotransferase B subunit